MRTGNQQMKRLLIMISLNVAYSTAELAIGLFTDRMGLVSDAFHLTFGCGLLTFSLFAMAASRRKPDHVYTYGYQRLEVLSAFTNSVSLSICTMFITMNLGYGREKLPLKCQLLNIPGVGFVRKHLVLVMLEETSNGFMWPLNFEV
ncbi:hypothetical protein CRYUN_Cryun16bG0086500 [Craigia yunnanensis]